MLAVVVAIPCGWLTAEVKEAREQRAVVEAIERIGGQVGYSSDPHEVSLCGPSYATCSGTISL